MEIVKPPKPPTPTPQAKPEAPAQAPSETVTLPKLLPQKQVVIVQPQPQVQAAVAPAIQPAPPPAFQPVQPQVRTEFDDGIWVRDPNTGQLMKSELDEATVDIDSLGGDPLRAIYQTLVWAAESLKKLAQTTPALAGLSPEIEKTIDGVATLGYQVTNTGAQLARGLWSWPFTRVIINENLEQFIHPEAWGIFNRLYGDWYKELVMPVEQGQAKYDPNKITEWVGKHKDEIADPKAFVGLCSQRYTMEKIASKSAWMPTMVLETTRPVGIRGTTTTGLESVFKKKPG